MKDPPIWIKEPKRKQSPFFSFKEVAKWISPAGEEGAFDVDQKLRIGPDHLHRAD